MKSELLQQRLAQFRLPQWDFLPDFGLYMDQMISYVEKLFAELDPSLCVTPAMINNYVKAKLIDRPVGKKYSRDSLAQLLMVCILKQTSSVDDMILLVHPADGTSMKSLYSSFLSSQDQILAKFSPSDKHSPMAYALESASCRLVCRMLLKIASELPEETIKGD